MSNLDNFHRAMLAFRVSMPPAQGVSVCRANKATLAELYQNACDAGAAMFSPIPSMPADAPAGAIGVFCGVALVCDDSLADGAFAFSQRIGGREWVADRGFTDDGPQFERITGETV